MISSRLSVSDLNLQTQKGHSTKGSPYFNHFRQLVLGPFSKDSANKLLQRGENQFTPIDKKFLLNTAGLNPYFLQLAAHELWESRVNSQRNREDSYSFVWKTLREQAPIALNDTWEFWPTRTKQVIAVVALEDMPRSLGHIIDVASLKANLEVYKQEIEFLESRGYITRIATDKYIISSQILSWWISNILSRSIQEKNDIGNWLMSEHRDGILKPRQREQIIKIVFELGKAVEQNKDIFLKAMLENLLR